MLSKTYIQHYIPFTTCCDERQGISEQQSVVIDVRCFSHIINHVGGHFLNTCSKLIWNSLDNAHFNIVPRL